MLTPQQLQNLPKGLTDMYSELSEFVLRDIARRISGAAKITDTAEYQMYRARALGMSTKEITAEITRISGISEDKIRELILDAAQKSNEFDAKMLTGNDGSAIPLKDNKQLQKLMAAQIKQTNGACRNFTGTLGFAEIDANGQVVYSSLTDFLRKQMDMAQMKVATGVTDYNTAIRQACNTLAESGLRTVYYASGRSDRIEVVVRRALMTSVAQVTQKISEQNAEEFGADGWEISAHVGARPSHAVYQGRQYPNSQYETIVLPLINDYNCRHSAYPIVMGVTKPAYTEEQLRALDPPPFTYEGKQYTAYKAQQQMRKMERMMRKQKDRCVVFDAAGDVENYTVSSIKLRRMKDIYEDFCKAAGAYTEYERLFVTDYNRHLAGKTAYATRVWKQMQSLVGLTTSNGLQVTYVSDHFVGRSIERKVSQKDIADALTNTLDYGKIKVDAKGQRSLKFIGTNAQVCINPDTGELVTVMPTSTKLKKKYGVI
ncbi:MAG: phage minor capsid protein [Oscillospiraceae bacterium]|nr:phage minor capsid protein [Oscillospiraceae bacterium]